MMGPLINAAGIILGAVLPWVWKQPLSPRQQRSLRLALGVFTVYFGLRLTWTSLHGNFLQIVKILGVVLLSMVFGKMIGKLLRLQKISNTLGQYANRKIGAATQSTDQFNDGFRVCAILFCAAPLAVLASAQEGVSGSLSPLFIVKAVMDGTASMAFASMFGKGVLFSALPVLAVETVLTRSASLAAPFLMNRPWQLDSALLATDGILIFCVALIVLQFRRFEVADYFPSLFLAPLFMRLFW